MVRQQMIDMVNPLKSPSIQFQASNGWLLRFLKRFNLVIRRVSNSGRKLPKDCTGIVYNYLKSVNETIIDKNYAANEVIYFDEMSMCVNMLENLNCDGLARKSLPCAEKMRLSCLVSSTLDGKKLPIIIVVPEEITCFDFLADHDVILVHDPSGTKFELLFHLELTVFQDDYLKGPSGPKSLKDTLWAK
jgi:hypothetical protein